MGFRKLGERPRTFATLGYPQGVRTLLAYLQSLLTKYGGAYLPFDDTSGSVARVINPALALGRDIIINGDLNAWTGDDPDSWIVGGEVGSDPEISEVGTGESHGGTGTGSLNIYSGSGAQVFLYQAFLVPGKTYKATIVISSISGTLQLTDGTQVIASWTTTGTKEVEYTPNGNRIQLRNSGVSDITVDSIVVQQINIPANDPNLRGAITGVTINQDAGRYLKRAFLFDGLSDYVNWYSPELNSIFRPPQGALSVFGKVSGAGVWTDNTRRVLTMLYADANNYISIEKNTSNQLEYTYMAGGTAETITLATTPTDFFHTMITWDTSGSGAKKAFYNGVQTGDTQTIAGTWVGNLASTGAVIGALNTTPASVWDGYISHPLLLANVPTDAEVKTTAQRGGVA